MGIIEETQMKQYLVLYIVEGGYRGRWVEGKNYDDARRKLRAEGFLISTAPMALIKGQIDNPQTEDYK